MKTIDKAMQVTSANDTPYETIAVLVETLESLQNDNLYTSDGDETSLVELNRRVTDLLSDVETRVEQYQTDQPNGDVMAEYASDVESLVSALSEFAGPCIVFKLLESGDKSGCYGFWYEVPEEVLSLLDNHGTDAYSYLALLRDPKFLSGDDCLDYLNLDRLNASDTRLIRENDWMNESLTRRNIIPAHVLIGHTFLSYGDYDNSCHIERANVRCMKRMFDGREGLYEITGGHGSVTLVMAMSAITEDIAETIHALEDYSSIDDDETTTVENEL